MFLLHGRYQHLNLYHRADLGSKQRHHADKLLYCIYEVKALNVWNIMKTLQIWMHVSKRMSRAERINECLWPVQSLCHIKSPFFLKKNKYENHLWFTKFYYQLNIIAVYRKIAAVSPEECFWMYHSTLAFNLNLNHFTIYYRIFTFILNMCAFKLYIFTSALIKIYNDRGRHQQHRRINTDC